MDIITVSQRGVSTQGQTSQGITAIPISCDWLDVTFPEDSALSLDLSEFLAGHGAVEKSLGDSCTEYRFPLLDWGNVQLHSSGRGWCRASASGGMLSYMRDKGFFQDYLFLLGSYPHVITRLDAALDVRAPAAPVIQSLISRYPTRDSLVYLTRKGIHPEYNLQPCDPSTGFEGVSGTFYAGKGTKAKVTARVYDKQSERLSRAGIVTGPWTRYELTVRKGVGASLKDADNPTALFWHFMSPALLSCPGDVPEWVPFDGELWGPGAPVVDDYQRLRSHVSSCPALDSLMERADLLGPDGRLILLRLLRSRLGLTSVSIPDPD